jgi:hypothetical protein
MAVPVGVVFLLLALALALYVRHRRKKRLAAAAAAAAAARASLDPKDLKVGADGDDNIGSGGRDSGQAGMPASSGGAPGAGSAGGAGSSAGAAGSGGQAGAVASRGIGSVSSMLKARSDMAVLRDLKIGPLLGRGSYGRVYKGEQGVLPNTHTRVCCCVLLNLTASAILRCSELFYGSIMVIRVHCSHEYLPTHCSVYQYIVK